MSGIFSIRVAPSIVAAHQFNMEGISNATLLKDIVAGVVAQRGGGLYRILWRQDIQIAGPQMPLLMRKEDASRNFFEIIGAMAGQPVDATVVTENSRIYAIEAPVLPAGDNYPAHTLDHLPPTARP